MPYKWLVEKENHSGLHVPQKQKVNQSQSPVKKSEFLISDTHKSTFCGVIKLLLLTGRNSIK